MPGRQYASRFSLYSAHFTVFFLALMGGLATSRLLYEGLFPNWLWLGRPLFALSFALVVAFGGWAVWLYVSQRRSTALPPVILAPLLLNLTYLANPAVDLVRSRLTFAASIWLVGLLLALHLVRDRRWLWLGFGFVLAALLPVYLLTMSYTVGRADTFEFQVVAPQLGIVHPTGYPLYLLLGKLFTLLPLGSVAWRLNLGSAVFAAAAMCFLFLLLLRLGKRPLPAILGAVVTGLSLTFWSQAIEAEVYALHALVVVTALFLMREIGDWRLEIEDENRRGNITSDHRSPSPHHPITLSPHHLIILLAFVIGLGLTNHLTTVFLIPPALLTVLFYYWDTHQQNTDHRLPFTDYGFILKIAAAFLLPLLLYAYLPLRWQAVIGEPMGFGRFIDWVVGGRFQGALQWQAWLQDPTRYEIVGRLFMNNWGAFNLALALVGVAYLAWRRWQAAAVLLLTWFGYTFYCLNYIVPDLAVFLIPAQLLTGLFWALGVTTVLHLFQQRLSADQSGKNRQWQLLLALALILPALLAIVDTWFQVDQSVDDGRTQWGQGVLALPLAPNAAILADSDKYAPLYYLQQAEGIRPDLDIMVLPDEAAYRRELDARLAAGQTVYLARFLPGLAGSYHLRSLGPLTEVSPEPLSTLPERATSRQLTLSSIRLVGYELETEAAINPQATAVTLYWQTDAPLDQNLYVFVRWAGDNFVGDPDVATGQHPANNNYPTVAWRPGEIVADFHAWPRPILTKPAKLALQVALGAPFTAPDALDWQTVTEVKLAATGQRDLARPLRMILGQTAVSAADFPIQTRPQQTLSLHLSGIGRGKDLAFQLHPANDQQPTVNSQQLTINRLPLTINHPPFILATEIETDVPNGRYTLAIAHPDGAMCGWLQPTTETCRLGELIVSGAPLPPGATNFGDKIALLEVDVDDTQLQPGGQLALTLHWQGLVPMSENYTVSVQILDAQDKIVGQIDRWPVQGTFPTSQWEPGQTVLDRYIVPLDAGLAPGQYRLLVVLYRLETSQRLPVLNEAGQPITDRYVLAGLVVPFPRAR